MPDFEPEPVPRHRGLSEELAAVLNRYSVENTCNTPDFLLANFLMREISAASMLVNRRDAWYGFYPEIGDDATSSVRFLMNLLHKMQEEGAGGRLVIEFLPDDSETALPESGEYHVEFDYSVDTETAFSSTGRSYRQALEAIWKMVKPS